MALNFPNNPTNGQTFVAGATTFTFDGVKWTAGVSAGAVGYTGSRGIPGEAAAVGYTGSAGTNGFTGSAGFLITSGNNGATVSGTITPDSSVGHFNIIGLTGTVTLASPSGPTSDGQKLLLRIKDNGTSRSINWTTGSPGSYRAVASTLPTATTSGKVTYVGCVYNAQDSRWDVIAVGTEV